MGLIVYNYSKSVLGRVGNCVGEQALCCEVVASSYMCLPNHSYADSIFRLHSDHTCGCVVAGCAAQCLVRTTPPRDYPTVVFIGLWPHSFHKIMYFYSVCLVSTIRAMTPPSQNVSAILTYRGYVRTLPNTLLINSKIVIVKLCGYMILLLQQCIKRWHDKSPLMSCTLR
jgi:hypothetical protein